MDELPMSLHWRRGGTRLIIRRYEPADEPDWLVCHALVDRRRQLEAKPRYERRSLELVATTSVGELVGYLDVEVEDVAGELCWAGEQRSAMVHELGVMREYRGYGLARRMLAAAVQILRNGGIHRLELWATDDSGRAFADKIGCRKIAEYRQLDLRQYGAKIERMLRQSSSRATLYHIDFARLEAERARFGLAGDLLCTGFELTW